MNIEPTHLIACYICKENTPIALCHQHHKIPQAAGGKDHPTNLLWLCGGCHMNMHRVADYFKPADKLRFKVQYDYWKSQNQVLETGTPLEKVAWITKSQVEELKYFGCRTVEQLAGMTDNNAQQFAGIITLKQKAQAWLEEADNSQASSLVDRVAELEAERAADKEMIRKLNAQLEAMESEEEDED